MRSRSLVLALLVVVGTAIPLAAAEKDRVNTTPTPSHDDEGKATADEHREDGGHRPAATGAFQLSGASQHVTGTYVSFSYDETGLHAYSLGSGGALFDATMPGTSPAGPGKTGVSASGAQVVVRTSHFTLHVHDNPEAVTQIATNGSITLTFTSGATLARAGDDEATFTLGGVNGRVRGDDLQIAGSVLTASDRLLVFTTLPHGGFDSHREDIAKAMGKGHVGVEASFNKASDHIDEDVVSFGNVTLTTIKKETGNLTLQVEGHGFDGRVLVLNVDKRVVKADRESDVQVMFDNASVGRADSLADILDPDNDGLVAEYYVVFDPAQDAFQLIVSVPHYSVHTLSIGNVIVLPPPSVVIGVLAGVVLLVPTAMLLFRRSK